MSMHPDKPSTIKNQKKKFSKNTPEADRIDVKNILQVSEGMGNRKYLGMPSMVGRVTRNQFLDI